MSERDDLRALVVELADARFRYDEARAECEAGEAAFKRANGAIFLVADQARRVRDDLEGEIRARNYSAEERAPAPGLTVKMLTTVSYTPSTALGWAVENQHYNLLTLNARAFEQVAKGLRLDFVVITEVPTVTIARDLSWARVEIKATIAAEATAMQETGIEPLALGDDSGLDYSTTPPTYEPELEAQSQALRAAGCGPYTEALVGTQDVAGFFDKAAALK